MNWKKEEKIYNFLVKLGLLPIPFTTIGTVIGLYIGDMNLMMGSFMTGMTCLSFSGSAFYVVSMKKTMREEIESMSLRDKIPVECFINDSEANDLQSEKIYAISPRELGLEEDYTNEVNDTLSYSSYVNEEQESQYEPVENKPKVRSIGTKK